MCRVNRLYCTFRNLTIMTQVRAIRTGNSFKDSPDVISALLPPPATAASSSSPSACGAVHLSASSSNGTVVTSGNLKATVTSDGKLVFTRISDGAVLLQEKTVRVLQPTVTIPAVAGFDSLQMVFEAVQGERLYGLGQHAAFSWDKNYPKNGQLDQKGL